MQTPDDLSQCLRRFAANRSEEDFRQLVEAYSGMVLAVARRKLNGSESQAAEVAQQVFTELARRAPTLPQNIVPGAWLHRVTCTRAALLVRSESRRRKYEAAAAMIFPDSPPAEAAVWSELAPVLDDELNRLPAGDRTALVLRFYEKHGIREVGERLGTTEEGARKRITRALEKLRTRFVRRGFVAPAVPLLGTLLIQRAVEAATVPAGVVRALALQSLQAGPLHWWARAWPGVASALAGAMSVLAAAAVPLWQQEQRLHPAPAFSPVTKATERGPALTATGQNPFARAIVEEGLSLEEIVRRMAGVLRARPWQLADVRLRALGDMIPEEDAARALTLLDAEIPGVIGVPESLLTELEVLLSHAARSDPDGALTWAKKHLSGRIRFRAMCDILAAFGTDFAAKLEPHLPELLARDAPGREDKAVHHLLVQLVKDLSFEEAAKRLVKIAGDYESGLPVSVLLRMLWGDGKNPRPMTDWQTAWPVLAELPGPAARRTAREGFVASLNTLDTAGTRQWLDTLPPEEKRLFAPQTVKLPADPKTGKTDPAFDWTSEIDWLHTVSPQAMPPFLSQWYGHSPEQLQAWLEKHPEQVQPTLDLDQGRLFRYLSVMGSEENSGPYEKQISAAAARLRPLVQILKRHDPAAVKMLDKEIAIPQQAEILRRCLLP